MNGDTETGLTDAQAYRNVRHGDTDTERHPQRHGGTETGLTETERYGDETHRDTDVTEMGPTET